MFFMIVMILFNHTGKDKASSKDISRQEPIFPEISGNIKFPHKFTTLILALLQLPINWHTTQLRLMANIYKLWHHLYKHNAARFCCENFSTTEPFMHTSAEVTQLKKPSTKRSKQSTLLSAKKNRKILI